MSRLRSGVYPAAGAVALTLAVAALLHAQPPVPPPVRTPSGTTPAAAAPQKTLYLVLRTGPAETEKQIIAKLEDGLRHVGAKTDGRPTIKPVSPSFVEELESLANRAMPTTAGQGVVKLLPSRDTVYEIKIPETQVLRAFHVTYQKAGRKDYVPSAPGSKSPLVLTVPGRYAFKPEPNDVPLSYEGEVSELGKEDSTFKSNWPKEDKFFVVTMKNFQGDKQELFNAIQDKTIVANPFVLSDEKTDLIFAFASLNSSVGKAGRVAINDKNELIVSVETLPNEVPRRVWAYFPLDEAAAATALTKHQAFDPTDLPIEIRKNAVPADQPAAISAQSGPKWHEIPVKPGAEPVEFERLVKLNDLGPLATKYPKMYMLVVWEFDRGNPRAILFEEEKTGNRASVLKREMADWARGLQDAMQRSPDAAPRPKN